MAIIKGQAEIETGDVLYFKTSADLVEGMTPQDNLLINSDFRSGVINQKGQTSYSPPNESYQYTIDLWRQACRPARAMKTSVLSDYIKVEMLGTSTGDAFFEQKLDKTIKEQCILTFKIKSVVGSVKIGLMGENNNNNLIPITEAGLYHVIHTNVISAMVYFKQKNTSVEIEYMKLEKGSFFTGMPVWDKAIELLKCYQNQYALGLGWGNQYPVRSDSAVFRIFIQTPVRMRKNPSLIDLGGNASVIVTGSQSSIVQQIPASSVQAIGISDNGVYIDFPIGSFKQIGYGQAVFSGRMILDSNAY